ncbi:MAG: hypothetical protein CVV22_06595 [Ignavibacteriae bacterium HGW-Ignavibacteriae-1]|nr:MAG: hypothetical protein CVV22_06595 [Ignavibacteriae bacterium HGW-Ignavibacteriae-1]
MMKMNFKQMEDPELISLLFSTKHKDAAFAEIYERYSRRVYAYCKKILSYNVEEANDVFQDVFIRFYNSINKNHYYGNLQNFLLTIARNLCLNQIRDKKNHVPLVEAIMVEERSEYERYELKELLDKASNMLEIEYKEVFILRMYDGLEYEEIAEIVGEKAATVRSRVWRAKERIKVILQKYFDEYEFNK